MRTVSKRWKKSPSPPVPLAPLFPKQHFLFLPPHFLSAAKTKSVRILFGVESNQHDNPRPFAGWRDGCRVLRRGGSSGFFA